MIKLPTINPEVVSKEIENFITNKVIGLNKSGIVIGISGGIDSAVTSVLCKRAVFESNAGLQLVGLIIPGDDSEASHQDTRDALDLCRKFNIPYEYIQLKDIIYSHEQSLNKTVLGQDLRKTVRGNMISRMRSNIIHTFAEITNSLVCGTGNKDEDYGVGYYTLFGDGAVHMSPIGNLSKRHVYEMAHFLDIPENIINKRPSARLEEGQTDYDDLGYGYDIVETIMECMRRDMKSVDILEEIKYMNYNKNKYTTCLSVLKDVLHRHVNAIDKAKLVSPDIAKITVEYEK